MGRNPLAGVLIRRENFGHRHTQLHPVRGWSVKTETHGETAGEGEAETAVVQL